jgi:hypothetical protein
MMSDISFSFGCSDPACTDTGKDFYRSATLLHLGIYHSAASYLENENSRKTTIELVLYAPMERRAFSHLVVLIPLVQILVVVRILWLSVVC